MKTYRNTIVLAALALAAVSAALAADITGKWKAEFESQIGHLNHTYDLKADSGKLTGKAIRLLDGQKTEIELKEGRASGEEIAFVEIHQLQDQELRIEYKGKLAGDEIKFTRKVGDFATMEIVAKREKESASVSGAWQAEFDTQIGKQKYVFTLKTDGEKLTGKANAEIGGEKFETPLSEGKLKGDEIAFVEMLKFQDNDLRIEYKGKITGNEIKLTRKVGDIATEELVAKRMR